MDLVRSPKPKVSIISTLMNEILSIDSLMSSLLNQVYKPNEIIIVDGGSTDGTYERLKDWKKIFSQVKINMKLIQKKGVNIAKGRNIAIKKASGPLIASIDGGCIADHMWLKYMVEAGGDVTSGNFVPLARTLVENIQAVFVRRSTDKNPSSRSIMFKKEAWKKVRGYPEDLYTGEDTLFNSRLENAGFTFKTANKAIVYWRMRPSLKKWLKQFYRYGVGDGRARIKPNTIYGKKVWLLTIFTYLFSFLTLFFLTKNPLTTIKNIFSLWLFFGVIGTAKKLSLAGFLAGLLLPIRYFVFVLGLHKGFFKKYK